MSNLCQKMTTGISAVLAYAKEFDNLGNDYKNNSELLGLKKRIVGELNSVLDNYQEQTWPPDKFPRISVRLGGKNCEEILKELNEAEIFIPDVVYNIFERYLVVAKEKEEGNLVFVSAGDLGFSQMVSLKKILGKAQKMGLRLCTLEMAAFLRLEVEETDKIATVSILEITDKPEDIVALGLTRITGDRDYRGFKVSRSSFGGKYSPDAVFCFSLKKVRA